MVSCGGHDCGLIVIRRCLGFGLHLARRKLWVVVSARQESAIMKPCSWFECCRVMDLVGAHDRFLLASCLATRSCEEGIVSTSVWSFPLFCFVIGLRYRYSVLFFSKSTHFLSLNFVFELLSYGDSVWSWL